MKGERMKVRRREETLKWKFTKKRFLKNLQGKKVKYFLIIFEGKNDRPKKKIWSNMGKIFDWRYSLPRVFSRKEKGIYGSRKKIIKKKRKVEKEFVNIWEEKLKEAFFIRCFTRKDEQEKILRSQFDDRKKFKEGGKLGITNKK